VSSTILSVATAVPGHYFSQEDAAEKMIDMLGLNQEKSSALRTLYQHSAINRRHSVIEDFNKERSKWHFWGSDYPNQVPGMSQRNEIYQQEAPRLAYEAAKKAIERWGGDPGAITHVISVSCTGMVAPGIEFDLTQMLKLNPTVNRLGINFMGCFGAFKGLSVARAFAMENPCHRILVVCTELCSLHLQADLDPETTIANSLFADGAAAVIVGQEPLPHETPLWVINKTHSLKLDDTRDKMGWKASDRGFLVRLSYTVPVHIGRAIKAFVEQFVPETPSWKECGWAIHPGGKSILQAVERALSIGREQTQTSWDVLANYGNMSSATFLFILERLLMQRDRFPCLVGLAFGPGLSMEGMLLTTQPES
jgi:predicted naringenin-chalcone synthase